LGGYVIGVDTGATKSHLALFDTGGTLVDFGHWGPLNHEVLPGSYAQFEEELGQFVGRTLAKHDIDMRQVSYSVLGIAGVDTKLQHRIVSGILQRLGFDSFTLANDAFLGIPAGNPGGVGICAINGTGSTLAGINGEGRMLQIGGVGFISADYGGGGMIGQIVVSSVYRELFRKGEPTCMTPALLKKLGISSKYDFVDRIYEKIGDGSLYVPYCSKMLIDALAEGDKLATKIVRDIGTGYAGGISCMIDEMGFGQDEDVQVVLAGSVFVKSNHPLVLGSLKEALSASNPGHRIVYNLLDVPPVAGAVVWALNMLGDRGASHGKVCSQLKVEL